MKFYRETLRSRIKLLGLGVHGKFSKREGVKWVKKMEKNNKENERITFRKKFQLHNYPLFFYKRYLTFIGIEK